MVGEYLLAFASHRAQDKPATPYLAVPILVPVRFMREMSAAIALWQARMSAGPEADRDAKTICDQLRDALSEHDAAAEPKP